MDTLTTHIAMDRRQALAKGEQLPGRAQGVALFADISGFTPLTLVLTEELGSQRGAEELSRRLNHIYGTLIAEVHRYGGSVVSFGGDAITCWFEGDKGPKATACALAMQRVMSDQAGLATPHGTSIPFQIKVAVTAGNARRFLVGHPRIQVIDVLAGAVLDRMASAEHQLQQGEVVVGGEIMSWLGNSVQVHEWRTDARGEHFALITGQEEIVSPSPWPELADLDASLVRSWLLPTIYERLEQGQGLLLAELRRAIPFFLGFAGIDYDQDEEAGDKLDAYVRWVQTVLAHYEGNLLQITMGDKGSCFYILFGAPVSHEDEATRAVAAAMDLQSPPAEFGFIRDVRIGISQGLMYVGSYGGPTRRTYAGLGQEVNFASRLMDRAESGQVLVSKRIADTAVGFDFEALGEFTFKGLVEPVPTFAASGQRRQRIGHTLRRQDSTPLVGRETEQAVLKERLQALRDGEGGCVIVEGEAGIGKSRLVADLQDRAQAAGVLTLLGSGEAMERSAAYHAWRPVFCTLFGVHEAEGTTGADAVRQRVLAQIEGDDYLIERMPLLNVVLPLHLPDNDLTAQMTGESRATSTRDVLIRILQRVQQPESGLLLIIEDAQWLDSASWALVTAVRQQVHPLLLVLATRPLAGAIPGEYGQLCQAEGTCHLKLETMSQKDALALACQRLGAKVLEPRVARLIYEKTEGHPFFSEELAYVLRDARLIVIDEAGVCRFSPEAAEGHDLRFPDTIQDAIISRIDHLPPTQQVTLKVASVIGRTFAFRVLRDVYPLPNHVNLLKQLDNLERLDITPRQSPPPDLVYIFKHAITQEVTYNLMLFSQRRDLHHKIALWYEETFADDLAPFYPLLAYHWMNAEDPERTIEYLEKAGQQALYNYANEEAVTFFEKALSLVEERQLEIDDLREARWRLWLGGAHINLVKLTEGREHIEVALAALGHPTPTTTWAKSAGLLKQVWRQILHRRWPKRYLGALAHNQQMVLITTSRAYEKLSEVYWSLNDTVASLYTVFVILNAAESTDCVAEMAFGYAGVGALTGMLSLHKLAERYIQRALSTLKDVEDFSSQATVNTIAGFYYAGVGHWSKSSRLFEAAMDTCDRLGDHRRWCDSACNQMAVLFLQGEFSRALQLSEKICELTRLYQQAHFEVVGLLGKVYCFLHQGELEKASGALDALSAIVEKDEQTASGQWAIEVSGLQTIVHLRKQAHEEALRSAEETLNAAKQAFPSLFVALSGYSAAAEVYLALWENGLEEKGIDGLAKEASKVLHKYTRIFPIGRPRDLLWCGTRYWLSGRQSKARTCWSQSLAEAEQLNMTYDKGLAHYEIGRHLLPEDPERQRHLSCAVEIFAELGAVHAHTLAQKALQQT